MADNDFSGFLSPDPGLAELWRKFQQGEIPEWQYNKLSSERAQQVAKQANIGSYGIGSGGYLIPNWAYSEESGPAASELFAAQEELKKKLAGKIQLTPQPTNERGVMDPNVFAAQYYGPQGQTGWVKDPRTGELVDPYVYGQRETMASLNDPNYKAPVLKRYDATGRELTPAELAKSDIGKQFAAAGHDIGFGPGMIAPGVKADTTERDAYIAQREAEESARLAPRNPSPTPMTPSTISSIPSNISPVTQAPPPPPVKTAPIDTILFDEDTVPIEIMSDLIFENIGGQELINIARNDTVNGQQIIYQPIKNLTTIQQEYNPNNIVALQATSDKYFQNFAIKFDTKVPEEGSGENGAHVYIDPATGSLVVEAINLDPDEQIELEISTSGTIYEAEI
jgi:hypothetical protein